MKKLITTIVLSTITLCLYAQGSVLDKKISLEAYNMTIAQTLKQIEKANDVHFSYSPKHISDQEIINLKVANESLRQVLDAIFEKKVIYREKENYIILLLDTKKEFYISGYIKNEETGEKISNASIYESVTLASSLSNQKGYYKIRLPKAQKAIDLRISKSNFEPKVLEIYGRTDQQINVQMLEIPLRKTFGDTLESIEIKEVVLDSIPKKVESEMTIEFPDRVIKSETKPEKIDFEEEFDIISENYEVQRDKFLNWFMSTRQSLHFNNIKDSLYRSWQFSILPFVGTNHRLSPHVTNDYSFNLLGGYAGSINKLELGAFLNLVRKDVTGVQIAGFTNVVGNEVNGIQIAGSFNVDLGRATGVLVAGGANVNLKTVKGAQIAGGANIAINDISGVQIAPLNYANVMRKGSQIGIINYSNENYGIPFGVFSYARKGGYRRLEFAYSELNDTEISFKTGVPAFYNIFTTAYNYGQVNKPLFGFGYGLGTSWQYFKGFGSSLEIESSLYAPKNIEYVNYWSQNFKASLNFEAKLGQRVALFVAPTFNVFTTTDPRLDFSHYDKLLLSEQNVNMYGERATLFNWVGYKFGIRVCNRS